MINIINNNCLTVLPTLENTATTIIADPPYGSANSENKEKRTCQNGTWTSVVKGTWDTTNEEFETQWLSLCKNALTKTGTIWIFGNKDNIGRIMYLLQKLDFVILNMIVWEKPNPPPNLACRCFTHSTEIIIWATKNKKGYIFNYKDMRLENGGKQLKDVWSFTAPKKEEKTFGKHPTQKPIALIKRMIRASTNETDLIIDPFAGSCTTGVAAKELNRNCICIELDKTYAEIGLKRTEMGQGLT